MRMLSTVMKNLRALCLWPVLALANLSIKISGSTAPLPVLTGPDMAFLGSRAMFQCIAPHSSLPVTYEIIKDGNILIATGTDLQGGQPLVYSLRVALTSEGTYHCQAKTEGGTRISNSTRLSVVTPASNTRVTSDPFPAVVYEGSRLVLSCNVSEGSHLSYTWFFNRKEVTSAAFPLLHNTGNQLVMETVSPDHAGDYYCMAWSRVQDIRRFSSSSEFKVSVKVYILKPTIVFSISKEGTSYRGNVTCWSSRGTPPANFSFLVDDYEVESVKAVSSLSARFSFAMVPGLDMGMARCRVKTEVQDLLSEPLSLEVVPVGGHVTLEVEHLFRADSKLTAAILTCQISRGTFPFVSWLLNDSILPLETHDSHLQLILPHYALTDHRQTLVLTKLGPEEAGYYHCRVRDSYDDSGTWVESTAVLVRATGEKNEMLDKKFFMATTEVISLAFFCFLFLCLAVGLACVYGMLDQKQVHRDPSMKNFYHHQMCCLCIHIVKIHLMSSSLSCPDDNAIIPLSELPNVTFS
ncbi:Fc receptor-like protein 5 isoform 2-T2 [Aulostomus maculatus]